MYLLNVIFYYLIILPISYLPYPILYFLSDFLYFVLYKIVGYRKKVIRTNIDNSFPNMAPAERKEIVKKFYKHLCDLVVESLKAFTINKAEVEKRMKPGDVEGVHEAFRQQKSVILAGGHLNNWELFAVAVDDSIPHQTVAIYQNFRNQFFDEKMRATRGKYGLEMISTKKIIAHMAEVKEKLTATIFGMDQSPSNPMKSIWMEFLNQDTSVFYGAEKMAKLYNYPVFYGRINKLKRGHYSFDFIEICADPKSSPHGFITETVTKMLEKDIIANPEFWLWSHKRWKRQRPADYKFNINEA